MRFIKPKHPLLVDLIKGYYVHIATAPDFYSKVTFYQNITTTISIYKDSDSTIKDRHRKEHHRKGVGFKSILVGLVDSYQEVEFFGPVDRLAIVFYPGCLNHFVDVPLGDLLEVPSSFFHHYDDSFDSFLPIVYTVDSIEEKRDLLDSFFLEKYKLLEEPKLLEAIKVLTRPSDMIKVEELAQQLEISRRTLLRKFKKHLGYSIEDYISVIKFRRALLNFQKLDKGVSLNEIALDSNYYDQADFNHQLKFRTSLTPKELFSQLNIVDDVLFWKT